MALRIHLCAVADAVEGVLHGVAVPGLAWPVLITRVEGTIVATTSVCPHEDVSLLPGELEDGVVTCPGHGYQLDLRSGRCLHDARLSLRRYPVTIVGDQVWIELVPGS
jgi:toluene monooxygenase system ferredoxin subunit